MGDPLSIAGSVVEVISLGIQVTQSLVNFYNSYKDQKSDLIHMIERLDGLQEIFQCLEKTLSGRNFQADERNLVESIETSIKNCDELIQELQHECQEFSKTSTKRTLVAVKVAGRRVTYPFRQSTLQKLDEDISEIRANLSFALDVLQLKDNKRTQDDVTEIKALVDLVRTSQISSDLRDWLKAPDATIDHNAACGKKHPGTGMWLVKSDQFSRWLTEGNSIMWLNGFAGSGKSVLCSTAIQFALRHRRSDPSVGIAFFYFTFNDKSKQDESAMLRALLLQLSSQLKDRHADLNRLHDSYKAGMPPSPVLIDHLRRLIDRFHDVYIVLDALDESPSNGPRKCVLDALETMRKWGAQCLHLFVTSRDESDIRESLDLSPAHQVKMQNSEIDKDISDFISGRLDTDRRLRKFLPYRKKIQESLAARAKGMFRWVDCQLEAFQSCPRSEYHLDHMLSSLPASLDETYERMLCSINYYLVEDARRILTLLSFAPRPLTVQELIDGVAVEINNPTGLNRKRRLQDSNGIRDICGGFIDIGLDVDYTTATHDEGELTVPPGPTVRIAHFSVQEYLESERIRSQKAAMFSLTSDTAHAEIAQICLMYLLEHGLSQSELDQSILEEYPLAHFAAMYWYHHYQNTADPAPGLENCILRLFQRQDSFATWVRLHDLDRSWMSSVDFRRKLEYIPTPVYYASLLGLDQALHEILNAGQLESSTTPALSHTPTSKLFKIVNAQGGSYDTALQAASYKGHDKVVQILLDNGANINTQSRYFDNLLQAALYGGHDKIIQMLLDRVADVNTQGKKFDNVLQTASFGGHDKIMQMLLDRGADVNAQGEYYNNALQTASNGGHDKIMQMLLDRGADVNAQGGYYGNALQAASMSGRDQAVQMLLDRGADVNAQGGYYGNALQAASYGGHNKIMQVLLDRGANVNAQGGYYDNALQAASYGGHDKIMQVLLDRGADVNAQGGYYGNALQTASYGGHDKIIQMLLDRGADVNAQGGYYSNALQAASFSGRDQAVQILLNMGADVNARGGKYGNALYAALCMGHEKVVQVLLDKGAEVEGGILNKGLQLALLGGGDKMVHMLLEKIFNAEDSDDAWRVAFASGNKQLIRVLRNHDPVFRGNTGN